MDEIAITASSDLAEEDRLAIIDGLVQYNAEQGYVWQRKPLQVVARQGDGTLVGGLLAEVNLGWVFVAALWVDSAHRRRGIGSALLKEAEEEAWRRGCVGIFLDTYSFQARPFYERHGYQQFGELRDCPVGETRFYLSKRLQPWLR